MKQFTIITKDGSKWLRPTDVLSDVFNVIYIGNRPEGAVVDESEVREIRQYQTTEFGSLTWYTADDEDEINRWRERNPDGLKTRTAYTDAESHDRNIIDDYWRKRCESAEKLIGISPSDSKSYDEFCRLRNEWESIKSLIKQ